MKKTTTKSIKISFQEKTSKGFVDRSFDTPKEHLEWQYGIQHRWMPGISSRCKSAPTELTPLKKSPDARRLGILPSPCYQGC